jgi:hypothetical protein
MVPLRPGHVKLQLLTYVWLTFVDIIYGSTYAVAIIAFSGLSPEIV